MALHRLDEDIQHQVSNVYSRISTSHLRDIDFSSIGDGDVLVRDITTNKWVSSAVKTPNIGGGGGSLIGATTIGSSSAQLSIVPTSGFSGTAGNEDTNGGILMSKDFTTHAPPNSFSQSIQFGPSDANGSMRFVAQQTVPGSADGTVMVLQVLKGYPPGTWTTSAVFGS